LSSLEEFELRTCVESLDYVDFSKDDRDLCSNPCFLDYWSLLFFTENGFYYFK
jgi:hypothetical protein